MDKRPLSALELISMASAHASSAQQLLHHYQSGRQDEDTGFFSLYAVTSLLYQAFILTLKAFALQEQRSIRQLKKLSELIEANGHLTFSAHELDLLKKLTRQQSYLKGQSCDLWQNAQELHIFCEQLLDVYQTLQNMMPIELHPDYQ